MPHPCYLCGERIINPFYELCYDHETIMQALAEKERSKNKTLDDFFSFELEKEISRLEEVSEVM